MEEAIFGLGGSEGGGRLPLGRGAGSGLLHHLVDLLQRQTLGLGDQEVGVDPGSSAETTPDEEDGRLHVATVRSDHVGGDDGNDGVPQPVGGSGETNTTGADGQRENLANDDPSTRAPGGGEEEDEDGNEGNLRVDGRDVVGNEVGAAVSLEALLVSVVEALGDTDDSNEELADQHAESTPEEDGAAAEALDSPEGDGGGEDVDDGEDHGNQEAVGDGASRLEELGRVVEDEVDTGPLLHHLERGTEDGLAEVGVAVEQRSLEAVGPRSEPGGAGNQLTLVFLIGNDLGKLDLDVLGFLGLTAQARKRVGGLGEVALLDVVTRRVGEEKQTTGKDDSPDELNANGDAVVGRGLQLLGAIDNAGSQHDTDGNAELVTGDQSTTDLARALTEGITG